MEQIHIANIILHVIAGTFALCFGLIAIMYYKQRTWHVKWGDRFKVMTTVVVITGMIGIIVFRRNNFLVIITLLSGYNCFSGIRALRLKGRKPESIDQAIAIALIIAALSYFCYLQFSTHYWSPAITYSTLGALVTITSYDVMRIGLSLDFRNKAVLYEHAYKMISALSGLCSAFAGTVLQRYQPYSQILPSVAGICLIVFIFTRINHASKSPSNYFKEYQFKSKDEAHN